MSKFIFGLVFGTYAILLGAGVIPKTKDPEANALWRKKYGVRMITLGVILIVINITYWIIVLLWSMGGNYASIPLNKP